MKKVLIHSILMLILFNSIGYYFLFEFSKQLIRKEIQAIIKQNSSKFTVLKMVDVENNPEFHRIDKKEFRYKGAMYDVVREIRTGQTTVFICLHDSKESNLFTGLKRVNQNKLHVALWDHLNMICLTTFAVDLCPLLSGKLFFPRIEISLRSMVLHTWCPPPESV